MKLLFENWRKFINEVSFADAKEILNSKRTMKIIKAYRYDKRQDDAIDSWAAHDAIRYHRNFINHLLDQIPDDLTDNQKGSSVLWLLKLSRENPSYAASFIEGSTNRFRNVWDQLETFFHHQRFMPQPDLMQVKSIEDLEKMAEDAKEEIHAAQEKKQYLDAEEGIEVLSGKMERNEETGKLERKPGKNGWFIAIIHNKGAACEIGKETDWCTASPGLDYFEDYYKPDDPLFFFEGFWREPSTRFQFHYGSESFMDKGDTPVNIRTFKTLHNLLMQTTAPEKYPVVQLYHYNMLAEDSDTPPEELTTMAENPDVPGEVKSKVAKNPTTPLETLKYLANSDNTSVKRAVLINSAIDLETTIMLFRNNPNDPLIHSRGMRQLLAQAKFGNIGKEEALQIIADVDKKRDSFKKMASEVAGLFQESFARFLK